MVTDISADKTDVGNYFIANYPPFSFWRAEQLPAIERALAGEPKGEVPLGLYLHIPFCRKRCKFCYFRVYTDVTADAIQEYVDALAAEIALVAQKPAVRGRAVHFVYFGGGTPSFLSAKQLRGLVARLREHVSWDRAREVTFECEPGTLSESKLEAIREIGTTRLSLGVENFDDKILEENGRAHLSAEIARSWEWIRHAGFDQVNIDLIAGMVGETWDTWRVNVQKTIDLDPDSVTIYQLELPFNTRYSKDLLVLGQPMELATWSTKRDWVEHAYDELGRAGYRISSAYTLVKEGDHAGFQYRDNLWHGADLLAGGVASFGHLAGVHYQNVDGLENYQAMVLQGKLPLGRALAVSAEERLIRELVLQLKLGHVDPAYFQRKFGRDIVGDFEGVWSDLRERGMLEQLGPEIVLSRRGLLRVDSLLPAFFLPEHRSDRYT